MGRFSTNIRYYQPRKEPTCWHKSRLWDQKSYVFPASPPLHRHQGKLGIARDSCTASNMSWGVLECVNNFKEGVVHDASLSDCLIVFRWNHPPSLDLTRTTELVSTPTAPGLCTVSSRAGQAARYANGGANPPGPREKWGDIGAMIGRLSRHQLR